MFVRGDQIIVQPSEQAAVLALVAATHGEWHRTAALIESTGSALKLLQRAWSNFADIDQQEAEALIGRVTAADLEQQQDSIDSMSGRGIQLLTILDPGYPLNLRQIYNRPPMLWVRGSLDGANRAIAIVGTRDASPEGLQQAGRLARELASRGVTVISGLAHGIDSAAHEAALGAGGRTVAVMGTGINTIYPPQNRSLADDIVHRGALVSQFWPNAPPTRYSFPMRNVVMSGMALGTVVIEASPTSGAKMQARIALEHGKRLFLIESLVLHQDWARKYAQRPGTTVVKSVDDIIDVLHTIARPAEQLSFG